jgi:uncharacterized repeat protein (TIGR01451 family)
MKKLISLLILFFGLVSLEVRATGEPSTYFNIFIPPNNDPVQRDVALIVTAIFDSTSFNIIDDGMDGDTDDSFSGMLMAGQSYILYIRDNGINDDARYASGGVWKQDGDYFIINSDKNVYASQATNSDWQHDWVPAINQKSIGEKFIVYAPKISTSNRDLNAFVYEDSTSVTIRRISISPTLISGYTNVNYLNGTVVCQRILNRGQDLIYAFSEGRNVMESGHTYIVESSKPITVQYGALFGNERDGGGYVPSSNGSSAGSLFYFAVPFQSGTSGEQEIRVVSWDATNNVSLERYNNGSWLPVTSWNLGLNGFSDWVGRNNGNVSYATVFRLSCSPGKRISVFEGNWFETGSPGTSDMATMVSSSNGTSAGRKFITYMAPPGNEQNVLNPFTGTLFGGRFTHLFLFSRDTANVTVKDIFTNGNDFSRTYTILPNRYVDCALSENEWKSIYNGTGTPSGSERPYLIVESDRAISVMNTNFNDNWMMYFGSSQEQSFGQSIQSSSNGTIIPGQTFTVTTQIKLNTTETVEQVTAELFAEGGLNITQSVFKDSLNNTQINAVIQRDGSTDKAIFENLPDLDPGNKYKIITTLQTALSDNQGNPIQNNTVSNIISIVDGVVDGRELQSSGSEGFRIVSSNTSSMIFSLGRNPMLDTLKTDSWTCSCLDYDNDGREDVFFTERNPLKSNYLFKNNVGNTLSRVNSGALVSNDKGRSISSTWADIDNDGDVDPLILNNTQSPNFFYLNNGSGSFNRNLTQGFANEVSYYHGASWVDYDNDGKLDLFLSNYWSTRFNELWHNEGNGNFAKNDNNSISQTNSQTVGATWADYTNDGLQDLFIPGSEGASNLLFRNLGNGQFERMDGSILSESGGFSVGSCWGDIDKDGDLDLFVANSGNQNNELFINLGNGSFLKRTSGVEANDKGHSHGCSFADIDNDADLDLYVTNDQGLKFLYLNDGLGNFTRNELEYPTVNFGKSFGHSWCDYDQDGDLDLFVATHSNQRNYFFINNGNANKWIKLKLTGVRTNRSAIGARVRVKSNGTWQIREVNSQSGFGGQSSLVVHFGLAQATTVDSIEIHWPGGHIQRISNQMVNKTLSITEETTSLVKGIVFADKNNNCIREANEPALPDFKVRVANSPQFSTTNSNGEYAISLPAGSHTINFSSNKQVKINCDSTATISISTPGSIINQTAKAAKPNCSFPDLRVVGFTTALRKGFDVTYQVSVQNVGIENSVPTLLTSTIPSGIQMTSAEPAWIDRVSAIGGDEMISWMLPVLAPGEIYSIVLNNYVGLSIPLGTTVNIISSASVSGQECSEANNTYNDFQEIVGAFDPNDLIAWPHGVGEQRFVKREESITYRIRFQNVGNYSARDVYISDELPEGLDPQSIREILSSHQHTYTVEGRKLKVQYRNIELPDSASNMEGSNGFFEFKIDFLINAPAGTVARNQASIVFDFNEPIITNSVMHTLAVAASENPDEVIIYPNPTRTDIFIINPFEGDVTLRLISLSGSITERKLSKASILHIPSAEFNRGFYLIELIDEFGNLRKGKLVLID